MMVNGWFRLKKHCKIKEKDTCTLPCQKVSKILVRVVITHPLTPPLAPSLVHDLTKGPLSQV